jgi:hypothetical protein
MKDGIEKRKGGWKRGRVKIEKFGNALEIGERISDTIESRYADNCEPH